MNPPRLGFHDEPWKRSGDKDCRGSLLTTHFKCVTFPDPGRLSQLYVDSWHLVDGNSAAETVKVKEMMMEIVIVFTVTIGTGESVMRVMVAVMMEKRMEMVMEMLMEKI